MINGVTEIFKVFAENIKANFALRIPAHPEDQLKGSMQALLKDCGALMNLKVASRTEAVSSELGGDPDLGVAVNGLLCGHVELKSPGTGANTNKYTGHNKQQWGKFKAHPNIIYTDGNEWALYRSGERQGQLVRFAGDVTIDGERAVTRELSEQLVDLLRDFLFWEPIIPTSPPALAKMLAPLCRLLRNEVLEAIKDPASNLAQLEREWREYLFPDTDDAQFADAYAQTLTYALLLAKFSGADNLGTSVAADSLDSGHGLLAQALRILGDKQACKEIALPVDLLERSIDAIDVAAITKKGRDPWLYFYEDFLAAYDPKLRNDRGVYYTPVEVVQAQVTLVAKLLVEQFGKTYSFADEDVVFLDPAAGTGTYPLAAIKHGLDRVQDRLGKGAVSGWATTLAQNTHAFEILVGPYAVAHLRLTQEITEAGGKFPKDGAHVYLTDTLESPYAEPPGQQSLLYKKLTEEHLRAAKVKAKTPVLVCMGNPPYNRQVIEPEEAENTRRKGGWVRFGDPDHDIKEGILEDFLSPAREAGYGVHLKNLYNDYVYFWRWALWKVFETTEGPGIVSFISASSYLKGPGFVGMRQVMRQIFDELWIIDLEGDQLGARKTENVFNIQTPVAIAIGVRYGTPQAETPAAVRYTKISGSQNEKLQSLKGIEGFNDISWQDCYSDWMGPFLPEGTGDYFSWPLITNLFPWQHTGVETKRTWIIGEDLNILQRRWKTLISIDSDNRVAAFKETRDRKASKSYPPIMGEGPRLRSIAELPPHTPIMKPIQYGFRSFNRMWIIPDSRLGDYMRPPLWAVYGEKQVFLTSMLTGVLGLGPAAVATYLIPDRHHFRGSYSGKDIIPLWRDTAGSESNITKGLLDLLSSTYGHTVTAEDFLAYCYALVATPGYVERFSEELTIPGPRIPLAKDKELFGQAIKLGRKLIWLHTYGERFIPKGKKSGAIPPGKAKCTKAVPEHPEGYPDEFSYNEATKMLHVGAGEFAPVSQAVWEFSVSGLEVVRSWLSYRMKSGYGRKSSPLDNIRPERWTKDFTEELLQLLWVLEATVYLFPKLGEILDAVVESDVFTEDDLPKPTEEERQAPQAEILSTNNNQLEL